MTLPDQNVIFVGFDNGEIQTFCSSQDLLSGLYFLFIQISFFFKKITFLGSACFEPGPSFRTESDKAVNILEKLSGWNPFPDENFGDGRKTSVIS